MAASDIVPRVLAEYGAVTRRVLARYLAPRPPDRHLYRLVADYPRRGGRMLRSSLCIATARLFGATIEDAANSAAALELAIAVGRALDESIAAAGERA